MTFGRELVVLHVRPSMLGNFWCMVAGSLEVWTKKILYWFIDSQTRSSIPRGAKMSLVLNQLNRLLFIQILTVPQTMHRKWQENYWYRIQNNQWDFVGD